MKKVNKMVACGLLSLTMTASLLTGCGEKNLDGTQTALVIGGEDVSLGVANYFLRTDQADTYAQMQSMMAYFSSDGSTFWGLEAEDGITYAESFKQSEVDTITKLLALRNHADEYGVSVTEEDQAKIADTAAAFYEKNEALMTRCGVQVENVEEALALKTIEARMKTPMTADIDRNVSDEEAAQTTCTYIRLKKSDDDNEEETALAKEHMQEILDAVLALDNPAEADLSELCKGMYEDSYSAQYHYNQGAYDEENNVLDEAIKAVLPDMKDGEVYPEVIEGEKYFFVVRMDHYFDREKTDDQKKTIISERETEAYNSMVDEWTSAMDKETKECWDKLEVSDKEILTTAS